MYLTSRRSDLLGRLVATLAEPHGEREIRQRVGELMLALLDAQYYASYVWNDKHERFADGLRINMDPANFARYDVYYQFHDPITFALQRHRTAVRVTDVMPQALLLRTEFFNDFLARDGLYWGVNLYAWSGDRNIGDLRIWRDRRRENFSREDLRLLDLVRPALVAALERSRRQARSIGPDADGAAASQSLSARENEVARLVADGLSDKEIARRLRISVATVRTHIDHAFRKLDVGNRVALARRLAR